jgi:hypothetical protein
MLENILQNSSWRGESHYLVTRLKYREQVVVLAFSLEKLQVLQV